MHDISLFQMITTPVLGLVIGWITNDLAIKMLFRPRKKYMIGHWHVPFTPGLIPSQKSRIAKSIGRMVSQQLLDEDTIRQLALSEATQNKLRESITDWLNANAQRSDTVGDLLDGFVDADTVADYTDKLNTAITNYALQTAKKRDLGKIICNAFIAKAHKAAPFLNLLNTSTLSDATASAINDYIQDHGGALIRAELETYEQNLMQKRICDLTEQRIEKIPKLVDMIMHVYRGIFEDYLGTILKALNIGAIVENKINHFSSEQLEALIFGIMKKELNAIVMLGAVLGFIMGFVNLLFLMI